MHIKYLLSLFCACLTFKNDSNLKPFYLSGEAQGATYNITYYATNSVVGEQEVGEIFAQLDSSLSLYHPYSLINKFNSSHSRIKADKHLLDVVKKSIAVHQQTNGEFDITVKPLVQAWGFGPTKNAFHPDSNTIKNILPCVGTSKISLRKDSLLKRLPCVEIDINGIAQGYSVDVLGKYLQQKGVNNYMVEIGGELLVKGINKVSGLPFKIGIETPGNENNLLVQKIVSLKSGALTTSGNYRKYYYENGKKISHLINPSTGYYIDNEMISVTVWARDAITADAYDNAFMAMGLDKTLSYLAHKKDIGAYLIYHKADGSVADTSTIAFPAFI